MKRVSAKRAALMETYRQVRAAAIAKSEGLCQVKRPGCQIGVRDAHHVACGLGRPLIPRDPSKLIGVCRNCHEWIHGHPRQARDEGWLT